MEQQLPLLKPAKPLVERLGAQFFREIPRHPGVYFMRGADDRLLYVGKATDLRQRLGSYRYVTERTSRKTRRLLSAVRKISWELTNSEPAACIRENELLRTHRPRFNRVNTYPKAYPFMELRRDGEAVQLRLLFEANEHCYGAFKSGARAGYNALLRLSWAALHSGNDYGHLPRRLVIERLPRAWSFAAGLPWYEALQQFLSGSDAEPLQHLVGRAAPEAALFHQQFRDADMQALDYFFVRGPKRNREWLRRTGREHSFVAQEEVDDLLAEPRA